MHDGVCWAPATPTARGSPGPTALPMAHKRAYAALAICTALLLLSIALAHTRGGRAGAARKLGAKARAASRATEPTPGARHSRRRQAGVRQARPGLSRKALRDGFARGASARWQRRRGEGGPRLSSSLEVARARPARVPSAGCPPVGRLLRATAIALHLASRPPGDRPRAHVPRASRLPRSRAPSPVGARRRASLPVPPRCPRRDPAKPLAPPPAPPSPARVQVIAREFSFTLSRPTVPAGEVIIEFLNRGQDPHNLNLAPASEESEATGDASQTPNRNTIRTRRSSCARAATRCSARCRATGRPACMPRSSFNEPRGR